MMVSRFDQFWKSIDHDAVPTAAVGNTEALDARATALSNLHAIPRHLLRTLTLADFREVVAIHRRETAIFGPDAPITRGVKGLLVGLSFLASVSLVALLPLTVAKDTIDAAVTGSVAGYRAIFGA